MGIEQRIGVNTGHLVAGDASLRQRMVTGDAVNVAARFEQAAAPGEVIIGRETAMLAGAAVGTEALPPLGLKGKAEPVPAFRVTRVSAAPPPVRMDAPMVGRLEELAALRGCLRDAVATRTPRLALVTGDAGVGKSRLADALADAAGADGALVLRGRCLSYGQGITFWPILEVVHQAAGVGADDSREEVRARLAAAAADPGVEERIASLAGVSDQRVPAAGAVLGGARRSWSGSVGAARWWCGIDDLHWAEDTLLDLRRPPRRGRRRAPPAARHRPRRAARAPPGTGGGPRPPRPRARAARNRAGGDPPGRAHRRRAADRGASAGSSARRRATPSSWSSCSRCWWTPGASSGRAGGGGSTATSPT